MTDYSDIINLPHHVSARHPRMPRTARAAQFGSFEPLRDYKDELQEERRLTEDRPELSEEDQKKLNEYVARLEKMTAGTSSIRPEVTLLYFIPDEKKNGGRRERISGTVRVVNRELRYLVFEDGRRFLFRNILGIQLRETGSRTD